jgi:ComF family protein
MSLWELVFPYDCLSCGKVVPGQTSFCKRCELLVDKTSDGVGCSICCEPGVEGVCQPCRKKRPVYQRAFSPFLHLGAIARAIHRFKYEDKPELAPRLADLLVKNSEGYLKKAPTWVCAVPLHPRRKWARRYDHARLLAIELAKKTDRQDISGCLRRVRATRRQVGLSDEDRQTNVGDAFDCKALPHDASVLLVDDVFTTGATAVACTNALRSAGAAHIEVLTLARAASYL